jgi:16S rRNA (cytidine1402-2'-O)-methyltransferase
MARGSLLLIPVPWGELAPIDTVPDVARRALLELHMLLVESERTARRYLARLGVDREQGDLELHELSEHTKPEELEPYVAAMERGLDVGVISEAGCPGIADPGAELARLCHERGIRVIALPGPSSILLAVMASGLGGQSFAFHGYLPVQRELRVRRIRELERRASERSETQVFMETPYRNERLFADLLATCRGGTLLCVARELTLPEEEVRTKTVAAWRASSPPALRKRPALFLLGKETAAPTTRS